MSWEIISEHASFGGLQRFHRHASSEIGESRKQPSVPSLVS